MTWERFKQFEAEYKAKRTEYLTDDKTAILTLDQFIDLPEYSMSIPTGVFIGKVWKRKERGKWYFGCFEEHENPDLVSTVFRQLIVVD